MQEVWKKAYLESLCQEGLRRGEEVVCVDEMRVVRVGLLGQSRRVWGRRGETVRQRLELRYEWAYLVLGVDPIRKRLMWAWLERVRGVELAEVLQRWKGQGVVGLVWTVRPSTGRGRIPQPPYTNLSQKLSECRLSVWTRLRPP